MVLQAESYEETTEEYRKHLQVDVVKEMLLGKIDNPTLIDEQFAEYNLPISPDEPMQLFALRYPNDAEVNLLEMGISLSHIAVPFDFFRTILVGKMTDEEHMKTLVDKILDSGVHLLVIDSLVEYPLQLAGHARVVLEELRFSFLYRPGSVVYARNLNRSVQTGAYPTDVERTLLHLVRQGRALEAYDCYMQFFKAVSLHAFSHFRFSMKRLFISLQLLVREIPETGSFSDYREFSIGKFEQFLEVVHSAEELHEFFLTWFELFEAELQRCKSAKARKIIDEIKQIIETEYSDHNLCLQFIADRMQRSVSYVSKVFKECEGLSVNDYCLRIRMGKAAQMLTKTEVSVKDIALAVGFSNENYFYSVFRKNFDVTPNEYRRKNTL